MKLAYKAGCSDARQATATDSKIVAKIKVTFILNNRLFAHNRDKIFGYLK